MKRIHCKSVLAQDSSTADSKHFTYCCLQFQFQSRKFRYNAVDVSFPVAHSAVSGASVLAQNYQWQSCCVAQGAEPHSSFPPKVLELSPVAPCTAEGQCFSPFPGLERCPSQIMNSEIAHRNFPLQKQHYGFSWNYQAFAIRCQRDYHTLLLSVCF